MIKHVETKHYSYSEILIWSGVLAVFGGYEYTLPKFNSLPLKSDRAPNFGKECILAIPSIFAGAMF